MYSDSGAEDGIDRLRALSPTGTCYSTPGDFYRGGSGGGAGRSVNVCAPGSGGGPCSDTDVPSGLSNIQPLQSIMKVFKDQIGVPSEKF